MDKSIFGYDPIIGCPFDDSEMKMVEKWKGFSVGDTIEFKGPSELGTRHHPWIQGKIIAIGVNAKYLNGAPFIAFAVQVEKSVRFITQHNIHHIV